MKGRTWGLLFLIACTVFSLSACRAQTDAPLPQLVIGCGDYEPYNYADADGEPAGIDVELSREACRRMGYEPVFRHIEWSERDTVLESGAVDCLWSCLSIDGQEERYAWVGPYMRSRQIVAVLESSSLYSLADLEGKSIGVRAGTKGEKIFLGQTDEEIPDVKNVYSLNNLDDLAAALRSAYIDAVAGYAATAREILENNEIAFRFLDEELSWASLGVAFSKNGDAQLRQALSAALDEMLADGTTARILKKYGVDTEKTLSGLEIQ